MSNAPLRKVITPATPTPETPAAPEVPVLTADQVVEMARTIDQHRQMAIEQLLMDRDQIEESLQMLGWEPPATTNTPRSSGSGGAVGEGKHCPICNVAGHDGRAHRGQGVNKRRFTASELAQLQ